MPDTHEMVFTTSTGASDGLIQELAELIVEALNLGTSAHEIDHDAALFGDGLGLDSIDALEIALTVQRKYGVSITQGEARNKEIFQSLRSLADFVASNRIH